MHPANSDGGVCDESLRHSLPSLMADRISRFDSLALDLRRICCCNCRSPATARRTSADRWAPSGTRRATGLSCRVMTTSSPSATRLSNSPKRVFASNAVTFAMSILHRLQLVINQFIREGDGPPKPGAAVFYRTGGSPGDQSMREDIRVHRNQTSPPAVDLLTHTLP